jgi:carbon monoxide dehydrogenase subunit G
MPPLRAPWYKEGVLRYSVERAVAAPPEAAFAALVDLRRYAEWVPGVLDAGYDRPGEPRPGATGYEVRRLLGSTVRSTIEITGLERPHRVAMAFASGKRVRGAAVFRCAPDGAGTRVAADVEIAGVPALLRPLARLGFRLLDARTLERLEAYLARGRPA